MGCLGGSILRVQTGCGPGEGNTKNKLKLYNAKVINFNYRELNRSYFFHYDIFYFKICIKYNNEKSS